MVAGSFNRIGSVTDASGLALYRPSTNTWASLGVGANGAIDVLLLLPDGDLLAGGRFSMAGGVSAQGIARFHPASNAWSPLGSGVGGHVNAIALLSGGHTVIVGGRFASSGNVTLANLAIYDFSTGLWSDAGGGVSGYPSDSAYPVAALAVLGNGEVIIGGQFLAAGGQAAPHVARYDPISNTLSPVGTGSDAQVVSAISVGGDVLLGGDFTVVDDQVLAYVARYTIRPDCAADFDCDGFVNSQDFFGYLVAFFGGAPLADFDHDGFINSQDFFSFVAAFFSGC